MKRLLSLVLAVALRLAAGPAAAADPPAPPPPPPQDHHELSAQQIAAIVGGGVAIVGFGFATGYGIDAASKKSDAQGLCPGSAQCATPAGVSKWSDALWSANASTLMFIVGCAGLLEAAVLWFTPPLDNGAGAQVGVGPGSVQLKGTF